DRHTRGARLSDGHRPPPRRRARRRGGRERGDGSVGMTAPGGRRQRLDPMRTVRTWWDIQPVLVPLLAILLSFIVGGVLIAIVGVNPFEAYWALIRGMFGSGSRLADSTAKSVPYIGSALALAFAMRAGLFNIG